MGKTRKNGRGSRTRGWKSQKPGYHQRSVMLKNCGKKCFLGPNKSYPICTKNTCRISRKGVQSAYNRARQFRSRSRKYNIIATKAKRILQKM